MIRTTTHSSLLIRLAVAVFVFFFLLQKSVSVDPYFKNCSVIRTCGGLNISFPFYIEGLKQRYCGNPGFQVSCIHNTTVLQIEDSRYIVHQIFYGNKTLRVSNDIGSECLSLSHKSPFPNERFVLAQPNTTGSFAFLYGCSTSLPDNLTRYKINCSGENGTSPALAMAKGDPNWVLASGMCRGDAEVLVEDGRDDIGEELVRRGFMLKWIASDCSVCDNSGGKCGYNFYDYHFQCFCPDRPHAKQCAQRGRSSILKLVLGFSGAGIGILIAVALFIKMTKTDKSMIFWKKPTGNYPNVEAFLRNHESLAPKRYRYSDVEKMTNSFKDKLGEGGYGGVYKGKLPDGQLVAVKVLSETKGNGEEFINEVASISRTSHVNVVSLLGFCYEGRKRALIYEFMANGSLEKFIYLRNPSENGRLGWETLYNIAVGIARGLEYLHRGCNTRIVHFDIKPHNILLAEDFCPKISDFGLAKLCSKKQSMISMFDARGTPGYIAPEVFSRSFGDVSHKSDVYSYGVMVSEMIGGRKTIEVGVDNISEIYFPHWIHSRLELEELGLQGLTSEEDRVTARKMIIVSLWCIQTKPSDRPPMRRVLDMLEGSLQSLTIPPKPFLFSPTRSTHDSTTTLESPIHSAATHT